MTEIDEKVPTTTRPDPYGTIRPREGAGPVARIGMSVAETVFWLVLMAVLSIVMIVVLVHASR